MTLRNLEPDSDDIQLVLYGTLKRCPFCGGTPTTLNRVNDATQIYQSLVTCSVCSGQTSYNDRSRVLARKGAIERWECRGAALSVKEGGTNG